MVDSLQQVHPPRLLELNSKDQAQTALELDFNTPWLRAVENPDVTVVSKAG
jgi:hypothetical protein